MYVPVIVGSTRIGRQSPKVAHFIEKRMNAAGIDKSEQIDLAEYDLPMMTERLKYLDNPPENILRFAEKINRADALVVVSPEYNGSYPGVLKNALDLLRDEYRGKPVAIIAVSGGPHGGKSCLELLSRFFMRLDAMVVKDSFIVNNVQDTFSDDSGTHETEYHTKAVNLINELKQVVIAHDLDRKILAS